MKLTYKVLFEAPSSNLLSCFDPRARILAALFFSLALVFSSQIKLALSLFVLALILGLVLSINFKMLFKILLPINVFLVFTWLTLPFSFSPAEQHIHLFSSLYLDPYGVYFCILSTFKVNATAIFLFIFSQGLDTATLASALQALKVPLKLCTLFVMMCRHIVILIEEFIASLRALRLRMKYDSLSLTVLKKIKRNLKTYAFFIASVLIQAANRAEKVRFAMLTRGYTYIFNPYQELNWGIKENFLLLASLIPCLSVIYIECF